MIITETYSDHRSRYYAWIYERQLIWYRRYILKQPPPWSDDPILTKFRFTNSYRELDRGTIYALDKVLFPKDDTPERLLMRTITYRVFNKVATYDKVFRAEGYFETADYVPDWDRIHDLLKAEHLNGPVFTNAHVVATFGARTSNDETKLSKVIPFLAQTHGIIKELTDRVLREPGVDFQLAHKRLQEIEHVGDFIAFEILSDLAYTPAVEWTEDTWANAGPGAREGLQLLFPDRYRTNSPMVLMRELQEEQNLWFNSLGLPLYLVAGHKVHQAHLTLRNIEGGLCEYYKFNACVGGRQRMSYSLGSGYVWQK